MKVLFCQKRPLFPVDSGWRARTLNVVRYLARWHDLTYLCNVQAGEDAAVSEMRQLGLRMETEPWDEVPRHSVRFFADLARNLWSRYPFTVTKDYHRRLRRRAAQLLEREQYDLIVCDFVQMALNVTGLPAPASVLFQHNVEAQVFERQARTGGSAMRRAYMALQHRKMRRFEGMAGGTFDLVVAVSPEDRRLFEQLYGWSHVRTIDTAVDIDYFSPAPAGEPSARLVFVGSLDWLPNEDAIEHFVSDIWPLIRAAHPGVACDIVGRNPSPAVVRLARAPGLHLVPNVPDVRPYLAGGAVAIVPLRIGGGTRLKVFEAMAMQKAVVSTSIGVEGLPVTSGSHLLIADGAAAFAEAAGSLLQDATLRERLAADGRRFVVERFSAETVARQFEAICLEAIERGARRRRSAAA